MFKSHGLHDLRIWFRKRSSPPLPPPRIMESSQLSQHFGASLGWKTINRLFPSARWVWTMLTHLVGALHWKVPFPHSHHHGPPLLSISTNLMATSNVPKSSIIRQHCRSLEKHVWTKIRRSSSIIQFQINITTGASSQRFRITGSQGEAFYRRLGYIPPDLVSIQGSRS